MYKHIKLKPGYRALVECDYVDFRLQGIDDGCGVERWYNKYILNNNELHDFINDLNELEDKGDIDVCSCKVTIKTCTGRISKVIWLQHEVDYE